jgi:hypothetical protein
MLPLLMSACAKRRPAWNDGERHDLFCETGGLTRAMCRNVIPDFNVRIGERLQEMTGRPLTIAEINDRIAAIRANLRELIEQAAANSGAADEDLSSNRIVRQEAELGELMRLRDQLSAAAHAPAVDNFR